MRIKVLLFICLAFFIQLGMAQGEKPLSPPKSVEKTVGDLTIAIDYSAPSVRGRQIYGELVPYGKLWRAGANEATTISFNRDVKINGEELKAGRYAFFVVPEEEDEWLLVFNTEANQWGAYSHDGTKDALKVEVKPEEIEVTEQLTYQIDDDGRVHLDWADRRVSFEVE
jgi:hypothetical protein